VGLGARSQALDFRGLGVHKFRYDQRGLFLLTDLGIACPAGVHRTVVGTPGFAAPEVLDARNMFRRVMPVDFKAKASLSRWAPGPVH